MEEPLRPRGHGVEDGLQRLGVHHLPVGNWKHKSMMFQTRLLIRFIRIVASTAAKKLKKYRKRAGKFKDAMHDSVGFVRYVH